MQTQQTINYDVLVIGGGASGMMAALTAAQHGAHVILLEKNRRLGEKLRITGGGRCNVTNAEENMRLLLPHYGKAEKFLYSAFHAYGVKDTFAFFESLRLPLKVEDRQRAFPITERADDVVRVLQECLRKHRVHVITDCPITKINHANGIIESVQSGSRTFCASNYILATGGVSRPETGSTGDGFGWLADIGHSVRTPSPSITPLAVKEKWVKNVSGVTLKEVATSFYANNARAFKLEGNVLLTHFGISGPTILNNAYKVADLLDTGAVVTAKIDCFPKTDIKELDQLIIATLHEHGSKQLKNVLNYFVPSGLAPAMKSLLGMHLDIEIKTSEVSKLNRKLLVDTLKGLPLTITNLMGLEKAVVADGGVSLSEIDMRAMRSTKINNLFITGDLLDINRPSGGYSLQLCWTTGFVAGTHAAAK